MARVDIADIVSVAELSQASSCRKPCVMRVPCLRNTGEHRSPFTGQYSRMDDPSTSAHRAPLKAGFGLLYYVARFYDPALGRFSQADSMVPGAGNPLAFDRYAYAFGNPLRYVDPSGHEGVCNRSICSDDEPDPYHSPARTEDNPIELTQAGRETMEVFYFWKNTAGWWQDYFSIMSMIGDAVDYLTLFAAFILSAESEPLWIYSSVSGWGAGGANDPKPLFAEAAARWFWNHPDAGYGLENFTSDTIRNALFNWLGKLESGQRLIYGVLYGLSRNKDGTYIKDSNLINLSKVERVSYSGLFGNTAKFNPELIDAAIGVLSPADPRAITGPFWTWGNDSGDPREGFGTVYFNARLAFGIYSYTP